MNIASTVPSAGATYSVTASAALGMSFDDVTRLDATETTRRWTRAWTRAGRGVADADAFSMSTSRALESQFSGSRLDVPRQCIALMHPPLTLDKHPLCREKVIALTTCHREKALTKFIGACNDEKWALDACLRAQKLHKARKNQEKARASKERLRARLERERA